MNWCSPRYFILLAEIWFLLTILWHKQKAFENIKPYQKLAYLFLLKPIKKWNVGDFWFCYSNHFSDSLTSDQTLGWIRCLQVHKICLSLLPFKLCLACKAYVAWKYTIFKFCLYVSFEMNKTAQKCSKSKFSLKFIN